MPDISYNQQTSALLIAMVALQQTWGVDFQTAVERGHHALCDFLYRFRGKSTVEKEDIVALMSSVAPRR